MPIEEKCLESRVCETCSGAAWQHAIQIAEKALFLSPGGDSETLRFS